jgi:chitinase
VEALGSINNPYPFLAVQGSVNGAKGRVLQTISPVDLDEITDMANDAVRLDTPQALNRLLSTLRLGFAAFEYMRLDAFQDRWRTVNNDIHTQLGYIESDLNIPNLQSWWSTWSRDYYNSVESSAQRWARRALARALQPFLQAHANGRRLRIYDQAFQALQEFDDRVLEMQLPPGPPIQLPPPW